MHKNFQLTDDQAALLPSDEDVAFYEREGYYVSKPGVLPDELIETAIEGSLRFYRGEVDAVLPIDDGFSNTAIVDSTIPRNHEFVSLQMREFHALASYPLIGAIAARLTRSAEIRLLDDQLIWKPPAKGDTASTITGWHADRAYWATCSSDNLTTAWIPLHDIEADRGPLAVMAGSHRWTGLQDMRHFNNKNLTDLQAALREEGKDVRIVPLLMKKGQLSFHHAWTMHAGFPNTSDKPWLSFAAHLQDGANRYRPYRNAQGREIHIADERLCRKLPNGDPDFSDPAVFPVLWSAA
ncbi:MAG: phytanoyl-CoA dioxygenase family protein [Pirellulales bacterium]